jgi:hypothetical protein
MIRARFKTDPGDPRPVNWPIKHPYWVTGCGDNYSIVVAYAEDEDEIRANWPDARDIDAEEAEGYAFNDRFPMPDWFKQQARASVEANAEALRAEVERLTLEVGRLQQQYDERTACMIVHRGQALACSDAVRAAYFDESRRADKLWGEVVRLRAEVERLNRILGRIVEGDGDSNLTIRAGTDAFAAAREYLLRDQEEGHEQ